jgi:hypothetical protein
LGLPQFAAAFSCEADSLPNAIGLLRIENADCQTGCLAGFLFGKEIRHIRTENLTLKGKEMIAQGFSPGFGSRA